MLVAPVMLAPVLLHITGASSSGAGSTGATSNVFEAPVHYGLRRPMGFSGVQKVDKTRCLFLSQKTPLSKSKCIFDQNISQIFHQ